MKRLQSLLPFSGLVSALPLLLMAALASTASPGLATGTGSACTLAEDEDEDEDEAEEDRTRYFAVRGADIHTGKGAVLRDATLLARDGKIEEIGYDLHLPEGTELLDVSGMRVYPGLLAVSSVGLFGGSSDLKDSVDPFAPTMILALSGGVTTAVNGSEIGKLKFGEIEGVSLGAVPMTGLSYTTSNPGGKRTLRKRFADAAQHIRDHAKWQRDVKTNKELKEPRHSDMTTVNILRGSATAKFNANKRTDLVEIARLAQDYGFRPVIEGCAEGWTVADELGRAGASAIITPRYRNARSEMLVRDGGASIENAAMLHAAGVPVAIIPQARGISLDGIAGRDLMHLIIEAGYAVRGGLSEQAALEGITIIPARMLGIDHRVGSLEVGKDCDLIVTDGDILHYSTFVQWAVVDGKIVYDKQKELYFRHIRPRDESLSLSVLGEEEDEEDEEVLEGEGEEQEEKDDD